MQNKLNELFLEVDQFCKILDKASKKIRIVESQLSKNFKLNIHFAYEFSHDGEEAKIEWKAFQVGRRSQFRLCLTMGKIEKPMQELKIREKIEYYKYIDKFVNAFMEYIKNQNKKVQEALTQEEINDDSIYKNNTAVCHICEKTFSHNEEYTPECCSQECFNVINFDDDNILKG